MAHEIKRHKLEVIIIDPLYLCALAGSSNVDASNMYQMGQLFRKAAEICLRMPIQEHLHRLLLELFILFAEE